MEDLQLIIDNLLAEHGTIAVDNAIAQSKASSDPPPTCPRGQIWNGSQCVPDIGN